MIEKPLSNIDYGLRGAAIGYGIGSSFPIALMLAKLINEKSYRKKFKNNWAGELASRGAQSAAAGVLTAIPGAFAGYKIGKFTNDSRQQQTEMYKNMLMAEAILNKQQGNPY